MDVLLFFITLAVATVGGMIAYRLKLPAGGLVGAMAAVITFNLITDAAVFPTDLRMLVQLASGTMIGSRITKQDVYDMRKIIVPTIVLIISVFGMSLFIGFCMSMLSDLDVITAFFASAPGGLSDMAIISADLGANAAYVAILQLTRILTIFSVLPPVFKWRLKKYSAEKAAAEHLKQAVPLPPKNERMSRLGFTLLCAISLGIVFYLLKITAGAMIGAMVGSAAFGIFTGKAYFPRKATLYLQIFSGAFIGMGMDRASFFAMQTLLVPMGIMAVGVLLSAFVVSTLVHKLTKLEYATCLLGSTSGGVQEMSLLADDLGADASKIALMQTSRLMLTIMIYPTLLNFIATLLAR